MDFLIKYIFILLFTFTTAYGEVDVTIINDNITLDSGGNTLYVFSMDENDHDYVGPVTIPLFKFKGLEKVDKVPTLYPSTKMFDYEWVKITDTEFNLNSKQVFDYDTMPLNAKNYAFTIMNGQTQIIIQLNIRNVDDNPPTFTPPLCTVDEFAIYTIDNSTCYGVVEDPDGWLGYMEYDFNATQFKLKYETFPDNATTKANIYLTVLEQLDYQKASFYSFDVIAKDEAGHLNTLDTVTAVVKVNDLRNNAPTWMKYLLYESFIEKTPQTFLVEAKDGDKGIGAPVYYTVADDIHQFITIDKNSGSVSVKRIDRDKYDLTIYQFTLMAYVEPSDPWNKTMECSFYVQDVDDNPPVIKHVTINETNTTTFEKDTKVKEIYLTFIENYNGDLNTSTFIEDIDQAQNSEFSVSIINVDDAADDYAEAFMISPTTGLRNGSFSLVVKDNSKLDYDEPSIWRTFQFYVFCEGLLNPSFTDKMLVRVELIDYNDEKPKFENTSYDFWINETAKKGEIIGTVLATDRDAVDQGKLRYELITTQDTIEIGELTGILTVAKEDAFDYDKINPIYLQVKVRDTVDHTATVPVTINLWDVNNKAPTISVSNVVKVDENQEEGTVLNVTITASDVDTNASLIASIDWENTTVTANSQTLDFFDNATLSELVEFLNVTYDPENSRNIIIKLICKGNNSQGMSPDFETFDSVYLSLVVNDTMTDPDFLYNQITTVTVLITINDLNDNIPFFPENNDEKKPNRTVMEMARKDYLVGTIQGKDLDRMDQGKLVYSCTADNEEYDWIDVESHTGALTVKNEKLVDADIPLWSFNYTCRCHDSDPTHISEPLEVSIYILDTNNKDPHAELNKTVYVVEKSNRTSGEYISDILIEDADRDIPFHTAFCSLDYDLQCSKFTIVDNVILVNVENGTKDLDRDIGDDSYTCTGVCKDNIRLEQGDTTQRTAKFSTIIKLLDINDHYPELVKDETNQQTNLVAFENVKKEENIGEPIVAKDPDYLENGTIIFYDWVATNVKNEDVTDLFDIVTEEDYQTAKAHLVAKEDLRDHYGTYSIEIFMKDNCTVLLQNNTDTINLEIKKFNFDAPTFSYPKDQDKFMLNSVQDPNTKLIPYIENEDFPDFKVTDNAGCSKWKLDVTVVEQKIISLLEEQAADKKFFKIDQTDECQFQLQVDDNFVENQNSYSVVLETHITDNARDPQENEAPFSSNITIFIDFRNKSSQPTFNKTEWEFTMLEADSSLTMPMGEDEKAGYMPALDQPIFYSLLEPSDTFDIDQNSGTIKLKKELDYLEKTQHNFVIVASNSKERQSDDRYSRKSVIVNVEDINNHPPVFDIKLYYGAIMPTYTSSIVVTVHATDLDSIDQDRLNYTRLSDFTKVGKGLDNLNDPPFQINEQKGQIELNFPVDSSMSGYIYFTVMVQDNVDSHGNGPFNDTADVYIFIVTVDNLVPFQFQNNRSEVLEEEQHMLQIVGENINNYVAARQDIQASTHDTYATIVSLFFIDHKSDNVNNELLSYADTDSLRLVKASEVLQVVTSYDRFIKLKQELRNETKLILESFPSDDKKESLEPVLKAWLIGVSVVLGTLCVVLLITFMLKIRQLKRTISNLVTKKWGSQESGLNRLGVSLPTANKHAIEGSNPVYSINRDGKEKDLYDYDDQKSVTSGDSDLIGVEENPEFDYNFDSKNNNVTTYL